MLLHGFCNSGEESLACKIAIDFFLAIGCIRVEVISHKLGMTLPSISIDVQITELSS